MSLKRERPRSLRHRLARSIALTWTISVVVLALLLDKSFDHRLQPRFDAGLHARARVVAAYLGASVRDAEPLESWMPEFREAGHTDFYQAWDASGQTLARSASSHQADLPLPTAQDAEAQWFDLQLPDGHHGRAIALVFNLPDGDSRDSLRVVVAEEREQLDALMVQLHVSEPLSEHLASFTGLVVFTLLFYGVFAFVRDIVCTTICPYGRLQGVLFDKDTMQIAYDYSRGEPRGKLTKGQERTTGDCIDCKKCIHVCPSGIDIRNGVQMVCVGCTACIDACDEVMDKVGFSRGLIRYVSENEISGKGKFRFTSRMKAYTALLVVLLVFIGARISMMNRTAR